tara:strand:- start:37 stop:177 length:141 start_codon:yes stop_codon:yes gene_type:complete
MYIDIIVIGFAIFLMMIIGLHDVIYGKKKVKSTWRERRRGLNFFIN